MPFQLRVSVLILSLILGLMTSACAPLMQAGDAAESADAQEMGAEGAMAMPMPEPQPGLVTAEMVRARPAPLEGGNGAAFMVVLNGTDAPVRLQAAESEVAGAVELHETVDESGIMKMIPRPDGFEIPAGGLVELKPGGKHVMLLGLATPLEAGQSFSLTLRFDDGTTLPLSVPVVEMAEMEHNH
ncbi:MAG: copper chaperone PCu(A)C [Caldilineaceae bacterium]